MRQSAERVQGRGGPPPSFGREAADEAAEDFTIRGGQALHLVLHVDVTPDPASLEALRVAVRAATRAGVLDGYAAAFEEMDSGAPVEDEPVAAGSGPEGGEGG